MSTNNIQPEFGVIGLGRMAQALVAPLLAKGHVDPQQLLAVVGSKRRQPCVGLSCRKAFMSLLQRIHTL